MEVGKTVFTVLGVAAAIVVAAGYRILYMGRRRRRDQVYEGLEQNTSFSECPPPKKPPVPEMAVASHHVKGIHRGFDVHVFENASDRIEEGQPMETQTFVMISRKGWELPPFTIEPRSMAVNMRQRIEGDKGLLFPKDEVFSKACFVNGPDLDAVRAILAPSAIALFRQNKHTCVDSRGHVLLFFESERLLSLERIQKLLDEAVAFINELNID